MDTPLLDRNNAQPKRKLCITLIVIFTVLLFFVAYLKTRQEAERPTWDYLLFTQQWPISFCSKWTEEQKKSENQCAFSQNKYAWTVHGLWPSLSDSTSYPEYCRRIPFNESDIRSIEDQLNEHWATTQKTQNGSVSFWKHEWLKHGTCAVQIPQLDTELKYFTQGLEWNERFNITSALAACSITPSDSKPYHISEVTQCLKQSFGFIPQLNCFHDEILGKDVVMEIRLCVDRDLKFANCDEFGAINDCDDEFMYPVTVSQLQVT